MVMTAGNVSNSDEWCRKFIFTGGRWYFLAAYYWAFLLSFLLFSWTFASICFCNFFCFILNVHMMKQLVLGFILYLSVAVTGPVRLHGFLPPWSADFIFRYFHGKCIFLALARKFRFSGTNDFSDTFRSMRGQQKEFNKLTTCEDYGAFSVDRQI